MFLGVWNNFLRKNCIKPDEVINFAHLFWWYGGQDQIIENPYQFLAYFYYRLDFNVSKFDESDILDSIAITIPPNAGFSNTNLFYNSQYMPENDEELVEEVNNLKNSI